jgi:cell division protein FtsQ
MPKMAPPKQKMNWKFGLRLTVWLVVLTSLAYGGKEVHSFLLEDPRFGLECDPAATTCATLEVRGTIYASKARIQSVFAADYGKSVFLIPLAERRRHLLAIDWVSSATISRVWPNRIVVTVTERRPVAFAKLPIGDSARYRLALIDHDGVLLSLPPKVRFRLPVLSGITEEQPEPKRRAEVESMEHLLDDLGPQAEEISEINASTPEDMRLITDIDGHAVELWIGDQRYRSRYTNFTSHYAEIRRHADQSSVFDLRMDDRILAK